MGNPDEQHVSWWTLVKDRRKREIHFGCWTLNWISGINFSRVSLSDRQSESTARSTQPNTTSRKRKQKPRVHWSYTYVLKSFGKWKFGHHNPHLIGNWLRRYTQLSRLPDHPWRTMLMSNLEAMFTKLIFSWKPKTFLVDRHNHSL